MAALREIFARFGVEFDGQPLRRGEGQVASLTDRLRQLGAVVAGAAIVQGTRAFVTEMASVGDELDKTARVIGIASQDLQSWRHAANLSGVSAGDFSNSLVRLQRMTYDAAQGNAAASDAFRALGVSVTDAGGELRPVQEILSGMADGLQALENPSERVALLNTLMGRSGARLGPLFAGGAAGVEEMRAELTALGGGASPEFIQAAADITDAFARQDLAILSLKTRLGVVLLPLIERATEGMTKLAAGLSEVADNTHLIGAAAAVATSLLVAFKGAAVASAVASAAAWVAASWPIILGFALIGVAIVAVTLLIEDFLAMISGGESVGSSWVDSINAQTLAWEKQGGVLGTLAMAWNALLLLMKDAVRVGAMATNAVGLTDLNVTELGTLGPALDFRGAPPPPAPPPPPPGTGMSRREQRQARRAADAAIAERVANPVDARPALGGGYVMVPRREPTPPASARRGGGTVVNQTVSPTINVSGQGLDERGVAREVEAGVRRAMEAANASALEDLEPQGAP